MEPSSRELRREILMIHTIGTPENESKKVDLRHALWFKGYFEHHFQPYLKFKQKDIETNSKKESDIQICRICGETCEVCDEHGTPEQQENLIKEQIELSRLRKKWIQDGEEHRRIINRLMCPDIPI